MRRGPRISKFVAGLMGLAVLVVIAYGAIAKQTPWHHDFELEAVFRNSNGLQHRSPVRIAGVNIGEVESVERGPGGTGVVTMAIKEAGLPIHADAVVKVRPRIFLEGNFFVDLEPGTPGTPTVKDGHKLPIAQTATPVQLDQILSTLQRPTRQALTEVVHTLAEGSTNGGARELHGTLVALEPALVPAAQVAEATRGQNPGDLSGFVRYAGLTAQAANRGEHLASLVRGLDRTTGALARRHLALSQSVSGLDSLLRTTRPALASLNRAFPPTRAFVAEARPGLRAAPETLRLTNPVLAQAQKLVGKRELPALLSELEPAQRSLAALEPPLRQTLDLLTPVTECLRTNAVPTLKKSVDDGPLSSGEPVYRELLYGLTGLASASQNFDANGPAVRYHAGVGDQTISTGTIPGLSESLVGLTSEPLLGSRPRYTAKQPPFRPDVACTSQEPPNLKADAGPAESASRGKGRSR